MRQSVAGTAPESAHRVREVDRGSRPARSRFAIAARKSHLALARPKQFARHMAAVFALVFLFVLAAGGLLLKVLVNEASFASIFALVTFLALAWGVFVGLFKLSRGWEDESLH